MIPLFNGLFWNCQGCVHPRFSNFLWEYKKEVDLDFLALYETRISGEKADVVIGKLGFDHSFWVEAKGFSGGIWVLWNSGLMIDILRVHEQYIHLRISDLSEYSKCLCTRVYGSPHRVSRDCL